MNVPLVRTWMYCPDTSALILPCRITLPPVDLLPVNISLRRSVNSASALPDRKSSSARSMPVDSPFTGLYPVIGANASGSRGYWRRYLSESVVATLCAIGTPSTVAIVPRCRWYSVS